MHEARPYTEDRWLQELDPFQKGILLEIISVAQADLYPSTIPIHDESNPGSFIDARVPFHNFEHAMGVYRRAMEYCDYVEANGLKVNRFAVGLAAVLHDARYVDNIETAFETYEYFGLIRNKFKSKEDYSAVLSGMLLEELEVDQNTIREVKGLIRATQAGRKPETLEQKIIVRSDLDNISKQYDSFFEGTMRLVEESQTLAKYHGKPVNAPLQIMYLSRDILNQYLTNDLCFGDFDRDTYDKVFRNPSLANITRLTHHIAFEAVKALISHLFRRSV